MEITRLEAKLRAVSAGGRLINLMNTNFHSAGLVPPSEPFLRGFQTYLSGRHYHPDPQGHPSAREAIAEYYGSRGLTVSPEDIVICASTSEAYALLFSTFGRPGDEALLPIPGYPLAEYLARQSKLVPAWFHRRFEANYRIERESLERRIGVGTTFVVAVSPDNPTGSVLSQDEVGILCRAAKGTSAFLVWDEVFVDLLFERAAGMSLGPGVPPGPKVPPGHPLLEPEAPVTFILNGASKLFASPDLKIGWIVVAGDPRRRRGIRERLTLANDHFLSASPFSQAVLPLLFAELSEFQAGMRQTIARRRELFLAWLARERRVEAVPPAGGIHALCRVPSLGSLDDEAFALALLEEEPPTYVHPGYLYGAEGPPLSFVLSLLTPEDGLKQGLGGISALLDARCET